MRRLIASLIIAPILATTAIGAEPQKPHNVLLFVADGLRPGMINEQTAPAMAALLKRGVTFSNTHFSFPNANHGQRRVYRDRPHAWRHRRLRKRDLRGFPRAERRRQPNPVAGKRYRTRRHRCPFWRQLSERGIRSSAPPPLTASPPPRSASSVPA